MSLLSSFQHSPYYVRAATTQVICVPNRAPPYKLLASEGGISTMEMCGQVGSNTGPRLWYQVGGPLPANPTMKHR
jgi:hypothetical protein